MRASALSTSPQTLVPLLGILVLASVTAGSDRELHTPRPLGHWGPATWSEQGPPPPITPALFRKFQVLLAGYHAVGGEARFTFAEWLVLNGVTEPREFFCMMWLWRSHCAAKHAA